MHDTSLSFSEIIKLNKSDVDIDKFNPYHDSKGKFTTSGGGASFSGVLLHGSPHKGIKEFDISRAGSNTGSGEKLLFFTNDKQMADDFSYERLPGSTKFMNVKGKKGEVYRTKVNMKKPLDLRNLSDDDIKAVRELDAEGILSDSDIKMMAGMKNHGSLKAALDLRPETLSRLGYDGLIANAGNGRTEFAVIDSKQTKILNKSFSELAKFNPYHDRLGRFASSGGGIGANAKASERGHVETKSYDESIKTVKQELGCDDKQAKKYAKSVYSFTSENYEAIRAYQNGKKNDYTKKFSKDAKSVEEYIDKAPHWNGGTLYRGINLESGDVNTLFKPGTEMDMKGTSSWSSEKKIADSYTFGSGTKVIFQCDKISKATSVAHLSDTPSEKEVLVSKDTKYISKKVSKKGNVYYVYLDEVEKTAKSYDKEGEIMNSDYIRLDDPIENDNGNFQIAKTDEDQRLVFGWALVAQKTDGETIIDHQGDMVDPDELEKGAYEYVLKFRDAGEEHLKGLRKKAKMVESCVFTPEKMKALGIPEGTVPVGWWIGFYVDDDKTWELIKNGTYQMFSIEGKAIREPVNEPVTKSGKKSLVDRWLEDDKPFRIIKKNVSKSFLDVMKFNENHDELGRFSPSSGGGASASTSGLSSEQSDKLKGYLSSGDYDSAMKYREEIGMTMGAYLRFKRQVPKPERKEYVEQNNNRGSQKEHPSGENESFERLQNDLGVDSSTAQRLHSSVVYFSENGYKKVRESQRNGEPTNEAKDIEEFIDRSPQWEGGTLYRGVKSGYSDIKIGDNIDMGGTASWSSKKEIAEYCAGVNRGFDSDLMVFVSNNAGKATSIRHLSNNANEDEVITSSKNSYTVSKIETKGGIKYVYIDDVAGITKALRNFDEFPELSMWYEENMDATEEDKKAAKEYYDKKKKSDRAVAKTFLEIFTINS